MSSDHPELRRVMQRLKFLPPLPAAVQRLCRMADDPAVDIEELGRVLSLDPSLMSRLLKVTNSAMYGLADRVGTVNQAIMVLGVQGVRNLATGIAVLQSSATVPPRDAEQLHDFQVYCIAVACTARLVGVHAGMACADEAFTGGMLHALGRLVLLQHFPAEYAETVQLARSGARSMSEWEERRFGSDAASLGGMLCRQWRLPAMVTHAVTNQHSTLPARGDGTEADRLLRAVRAAAELVRVAEIGFAADPCVHAGFAAEVAPYGVELEQLHDLLLRLPEEVRSAASPFGLTPKIRRLRVRAPHTLAVELLLADGWRDTVALVLTSLGYVAVAPGAKRELPVVARLAEGPHDDAGGARALDFTTFRRAEPGSDGGRVHVERLKRWLAERLPTERQEAA